jgi:hypothetical protein
LALALGWVPVLLLLCCLGFCILKDVPLQPLLAQYHLPKLLALTQHGLLLVWAQHGLLPVWAQRGLAHYGLGQVFLEHVFQAGFQELFVVLLMLGSGGYNPK